MFPTLENILHLSCFLLFLYFPVTAKLKSFIKFQFNFMSYNHIFLTNKTAI